MHFYCLQTMRSYKLIGDKCILQKLQKIIECHKKKKKNTSDYGTTMYDSSISHSLRIILLSLLKQYRLDGKRFSLGDISVAQLISLKNRCYRLSVCTSYVMFITANPIGYDSLTFMTRCNR